MFTDLIHDNHPRQWLNLHEKAMQNCKWEIFLNQEEPGGVIYQYLNSKEENKMWKKKKKKHYEYTNLERDPSVVAHEWRLKHVCRRDKKSNSLQTNAQ